MPYANEEDLEELFSAVVSGDLKAVENLLQYDYIDVNGCDYHQTSAILIASGTGNAEMVKLLLDYGAYPDFMDDDAHCPLSGAIFSGCLEVVKLLVEHGGTLFGEKNYRGALRWALRSGYLDIAEFFMERGAGIYADDEGENSDDRESALIAAIQSKSVKIVKLFLDKLDLNEASRGDDYQVNTPLITAASKGDKTIIELLLDHGARVGSVRIDSETEDPLHIACKTGNGDAVSTLLECGADVNTLNNENKCPLAITYQRLAGIWDSRWYYSCEILTKHVVKMLFEGLQVSEENLKVIESHDHLRKYKVECEKEIERMKGNFIDKTEVSFHEILVLKSQHKLADLARNDDVVKGLTSDKCKKQFPIYFAMLKKQLRRGVYRKLLISKAGAFYRALAKGNKRLPKLPFTCIDEILSCLTSNDFRKLIRMCDPAFDTEIIDIKFD